LQTKSFSVTVHNSVGENGTVSAYFCDAKGVPGNVAVGIERYLADNITDVSQMK
jgi:hypothetical protein